ncbi:hypothetical protein BK026_08405 [Alteromonas sp. V450]|uniref:acyltransferase family protein n=1 Tax=Alteromonas sp. V450 TaxID=1912139 RepID=UPI0008FF6BC3|nr:acyltransferase family protein [Alteromonas sp. V450]OJF68809.1 hypothetical protein BK026_08405 [Alteromonas sp. V450]
MKELLRLDIQGLRAIAVLSVVIFHIQPKALPGGYLGVDIFFVISGYLIIGQLWRALSRNSFSFSAFYSSRFKRLLPAYIVVAAVTSILSYIYLLPGEYANYSYSLVASLLYSSNFWFYSQSGYFSSALEFAPLLHTWSLSVEEQFYVVFPIFLMLLTKMNLRIAAIIASLILLGVASFLLSEWLLYKDSALSFFASPTRFWQFIAGGLLAITGVKCYSTWKANLIVSLSLACMAICFVSYNKYTLFPGINALPITLATVGIIYAHVKAGFLHAVLANRVCQFIGNISYSLYLWHWPVIVFFKLQFLDHYTYTDMTVVFTVSLVLAIATYYFIEVPFRKVNISNYQKRYLAGSALISAILAFFILLSIPIQNAPFPKKTVYLEGILNTPMNDYRHGICFLSSRFNDVSFFDEKQCLAYKENSYNILLIGDSHAGHWYAALAKQAPDNYTISQITASGCKTVLPLKGAGRCTKLLHWAINDVIPKGHFNEVIMASRWKLKDTSIVKPFIEQIKPFTDRVTVMGPVVEYKYSLPWLLAKYPEEDVKYFSKFNRQAEVNTKLQAVVESTGARFYPIIYKMCSDRDKCNHYVDNTPIQFDYGHLTQEGAEFLLTEIWNH